MHEEKLQALTDAIIGGKRKAAVPIVQELLEAKCQPDTILNALVAGMDVVGKRFKANEIFVPEVLVSARAMKMSMEVLEPVLADAGMAPEHTVVIGTVEGDLHDIGKNLVAMMLKGANFKVVDAGTNVSPDAFIELARQHNARIIGLSALLTTTMPSMKATVDAVHQAGLECKVMIGGAPVTEAFSQEIGANGYAPDAASAVDLARQLVSAA